MPPILNLKGQRFGRLIAKQYVGKEKHNRALWLCSCDCGKEIVVPSYRLKQGHTKSCGCLAKEIAKTRTKTHGKAGTRLYRIWNYMKSRCCYNRDPNYVRYGARGITVCDEWKNDYTAFERWALEKGYNDTLSIDRIDVNGNYEPSNCRWATAKEQADNRRTNVRISYNGEIMPLKNACNKANLSYGAIYSYSKRHNLSVAEVFYQRIGGY